MLRHPLIFPLSSCLYLLHQAVCQVLLVTGIQVWLTAHHQTIAFSYFLNWVHLKLWNTKRLQNWNVHLARSVGPVLVRPPTYWDVDSIAGAQNRGCSSSWRCCWDVGRHPALPVTGPTLSSEMKLSLRLRGPSMRTRTVIEKGRTLILLLREGSI